MKRLLLILLLTVYAPAYADVMLLVHGYLGDANSWEKSGINSELAAHGWARAGVFVGSPEGPQLLVTDYKDAENLVYVATLPSELPVIVQADTLKLMIDQIITRHPGQNIILVGHSAGGVVARMELVRYKQPQIKALITIASPHLGTGRADQALTITKNHGPFNMVKHFIGGHDYDALRHSRGLMYDLRHPQPGNLLYWLNSQPHPDIHYASIIRTKNSGAPGDDLVPGYSQDMNDVPALKGRSLTIITPTSHYLKAQDADMILDLIQRFAIPKQHIQDIKAQKTDKPSSNIPVENTPEVVKSGIKDAPTKTSDTNTQDTK